jgi:hypothetical protein
MTKSLMTEIDIIDWLESRVPASDSELRLHSMAVIEIVKLRKRVNELERELEQRNTEGESIFVAYE